MNSHLPQFLRSRTSILTLVLGAGITLSAADWPQYRGPNHNGSSPEKLVPFVGKKPRELWKAPTPNGFSSFTVADGVAATIVGKEIEGVFQEVVLALDAKTGRELWSAPIAVAKYDGGGGAGTDSNKGGDGPRSTPTLSKGNLYVISCDLVVQGFNAKSGKPLWKRDLIKEHEGKNITWKNAASPVIDGDLLFVAGGGAGQALMALKTSTGEVAWKGEDDRFTHSTPVVTEIHGARQVIFFTQSGLVSKAVKDGKTLWRAPFKFSTSTAMTPIVAGDIVYCSAGYGVGAGAFRIAKNGAEFQASELWRKPNQLPNHWSTPVHYKGHLYGMFSFKEYGHGPLKCVDLTTGEEKWSEKNFGAGNVILIDGKILALTDAGEIVIVEAKPESYKELSRAQAVSGKCWSTPVVSGGKIFVRSTKEGVCLDPSSLVMEK